MTFYASITFNSYAENEYGSEQSFDTEDAALEWLKAEAGHCRPDSCIVRINSERVLWSKRHRVNPLGLPTNPETLQAIGVRLSLPKGQPHFNFPSARDLN